ncbi:MAG: aminotransferase class V-fold PLP-dependent enzyme [Gemmatimonadetes bacterium]|nr:aminotransferase class V-fold PLP-dependent enzyme [Gemmatimonadota bacterium]
MNLEEIRRHYPGLQNGIQLNTGGIGLPSIEVREAVEANYRKLHEDHTSPIDWHLGICESAEAARLKLASFLGAGEDEITLTNSTADGLAAVLAGLAWEPGDEVVISSEEYPLSYGSVHALAERFGVVVKVMELDCDPGIVVERFERLLTPRTKMICTNHVTADSGLRLPAEEISRIAGERGVLTLWDGCQAVAQFPIDLREMGCDFYASNCYKWVLAPMGTGFLYVRRESQSNLEPLLHPREPGGGAAQYKLGHPAHALYAGVRASIEYMESIGGVEAIQEEVARKADLLKADLDAVPGVLILSSRRPDSQTGIVTIALDGMDGDEVSRALRQRWEIGQRSTHMTDPVGVRISVAFYTSGAELKALVEAVKVLAAEAGHR